MKRLYKTLNGWFESIPTPFMVLLARIAIVTVFLRSGLPKLSGMGDAATWAMFSNEIRLPLLPPEIAAWLFTAAELGLSALVLVGLLTRFAAFGLLLVTALTAAFNPHALDMYLMWALALLFVMRHGAGRFSLDYLISSRMALTERTARA
jgi:putative oxidoreductase